MSPPFSGIRNGRNVRRIRVPAIIAKRGLVAWGTTWYHLGMNKLMMCLLCCVGWIGTALASDIRHSFLATGQSTYILNEAGERIWSYAHATRDGFVLPSGNVLLGLSNSKKYPGGAVLEITRAGEVVFEYIGTQKEIQAVQPLENGDILTVEGGENPRILELNRNGTVAHEIPLACQKGNIHMQTRMARKLADGSYLAPHLLDFAVIHYDRAGSIKGRIDTTWPGDPQRSIKSWPFTAIRLPNGNTLCGLTNGNRVAEYSPDGVIVWQLTNEDLGEDLLKDPCGVQRLPNGNTVITSYGQRSEDAVKLLEVTHDKKVVWTHRDKHRHGIHHFQILTTNGEPVPFPPMK